MRYFVSKSILAAAILATGSAIATAQSQGDYRSDSSCTTACDWSQAGSWDEWDNTVGWQDASSAPGSATDCTIRAGHIMEVKLVETCASLVIEDNSGGTPGTLRILTSSSSGGSKLTIDDNVGLNMHAITTPHALIEFSAGTSTLYAGELALSRSVSADGDIHATNKGKITTASAYTLTLPSQGRVESQSGGVLTIDGKFEMDGNVTATYGTVTIGGTVGGGIRLGSNGQLKITESTGKITIADAETVTVTAGNIFVEDGELVLDITFTTGAGLTWTGGRITVNHQKVFTVCDGGC